MAYTLVSICVLILRYKPEKKPPNFTSQNENRNEQSKFDKFLLILFGDSPQSGWKRLFKPDAKEANQADFRLVITLTILARKYFEIFFVELLI